jgi:hypothetical protein
MKSNKKLLGLIIAFAIVVLAGITMFLVYSNFNPKAKEGSKEIVVQVINPNAQNKEYTIHTDAQYLRQALEDEKMIKGTEYDFGLLITEVDGYVADGTNQEWWCITKDGEEVNYGVDEIAISDGDHYEITLSQGIR